MLARNLDVRSFDIEMAGKPMHTLQLCSIVSLLETVLV